MEDDFDYRQLYTEQSIMPCPMCLSESKVYGKWPKLKEYVVCCDHALAIGDQDPKFLPGCMMHLPQREFHQDSPEGAIEFWNAFANAVEALREARS